MQSGEQNPEPTSQIIGKVLYPLVVAGIFFSIGGSLALGALVVANTASQLAAVKIASPTSCFIAIGKALSRSANNDGPATDSIAGTKAGATKLNKCFGAVITPEGKKKRQEGKPLTMRDYKCTGRKAIANVKTGQVTDFSMAFEGAGPGECQRTVKSEKPKVPPGQQEKPQGQGGEGKGQGQGGEQGKGEGGGMPQIPMPPPPSPKPPPPPPQDKPQDNQKKNTVCDPNGNCMECDQNGKNCKPTSPDPSVSARGYQIR